ncbi:MAG: hypothetical protein PVI30_03735 [Myxococcales bacterium]|jgi:hypothetical protein
MGRWVAIAAALVAVGVLYATLWSGSERRAGGATGEHLAEPGDGELPPPGQAVPRAAGDDPANTQPADALGEGPAPDQAVAPRSSRLNPTAMLKEAFEGEPRDALWAEDKEREIRDILDDEALPDGLLQEAACRTSVCRMKLVWPEGSGTDYSRLTKLIGEHWAPSIGIDYPPGSRERHALDVYIVREGYSLDDVSR